VEELSLLDENEEDRLLNDSVEFPGGKTSGRKNGLYLKKMGVLAQDSERESTRLRDHVEVVRGCADGVICLCVKLKGDD
jgi:hypothetical protein